MADSSNTVYIEGDVPAGRAVAIAPAGTGGTVARSAPAVELTDVAQRLGNRWALRRITLRIAPGEVVAVIGPNGSGKTTLLRVIATTLTPTRGSGRVFGYDLVTRADAVREVTGTLGHATGLYDDLTAHENLSFAMEMSGGSSSTSAIDAALAAVGVQQHASERVRGLSAGMRRRVSLARLVLRRPQLVLLDEPYNSFDDTGVAAVDALIRETTRAGGAVMVVTHDLARMGATGYDRVLSLKAGRLERNQ